MVATVTELWLTLHNDDGVWGRTRIVAPRTLAPRAAHGESPFSTRVARSTRIFHDLNNNESSGEVA
jgi:hypothetical protein